MSIDKIAGEKRFVYKSFTRFSAKLKAIILIITCLICRIIEKILSSCKMKEK